MIMADEMLEINSDDKKIEHMVLVNELQSLLNSVEKPSESVDCCIYRVPKQIRQVNAAAYTPRVVSIGPVHHGDERLKPMEELKLGYLKAFLERTDKELKDIIPELKKDESSIQGCYAQDIPANGDDFMRMILIDACFVIEYFLRSLQIFPWPKDDGDPIISKPWLQYDVWLDLILLENQLPFSVLEDIFALTCSNGGHSFLQLSFLYFRTKNEQFTFGNLMEIQANGDVEVKHFTDLVRILWFPSIGRQPNRELRLLKHIYSASQLVEAGVELKVSEIKTELRFANGVLTIPHLEVEDCTETLLRNIVALEQCHYPYEAYVTDYIQLLDFLINNSKDVDILVNRGIMKNWIGDSKKVANMVNHLGTGVIVSNTSAAYLELCDNLNSFYLRSLFHKYRVTFFGAIWKMVSSVVAIVLLLLTVIQAICAIIPLVKE